jgi:hypothetical protein
MPDWLPWLFFGLHSSLMFVDEFAFHRKRVLNRWERIGHPLDTLTFLAPLALVLFLEPTSAAQWWYIGLAVFSSIFITKDEWQHHELCVATEQWLHALLFIIHPIMLWLLYRLWLAGDSMLPLIMFIGAAGMLLHQSVYWNVLEPRRARQ